MDERRIRSRLLQWDMTIWTDKVVMQFPRFLYDVSRLVIKRNVKTRMHILSLLLQENGYMFCGNEPSDNGSRYDKFSLICNNNLRSPVWVGNTYVEIQGEPTALYYRRKDSGFLRALLDFLSADCDITTHRKQVILKHGRYLDH